ncbi:MAG TPA: glycosyltransferase family 4 protein [Solirubrobacterales bacterium]|jgi:glycosyltransferase involved in cell wall biosynthesis
MTARRVVVVSMPNVVPHNQLVYQRLAELGWDVKYVVPNRWRDDYTPGGFTPAPLDGIVGTFARVRVALPGQVQRHFYVARPARWLRRWHPDAVFVELEPFSVPTLQWGQAAERLGIPWGVQGDENLDRPLPLPARLIRHWSMPRIDFFAARSPGGEKILRRWGAAAEIGIVPHTIPEWEAPERRRPDDELFTIGFAGRLVEAKGIRDLLDAARRLDFPFRLLVVGDGPLSGEIEAVDLGAGVLELRRGVRSAAMPALYARMDLLVLPSRTTETWAEQFGKVLCEALLCGTAVIGSSSGEIPWVIETTGGGLVFPEGNAEGLARAISDLRADPAERERLAREGRAGVERHFSPRVAARELDRLLRGVLLAGQAEAAGSSPSRT